MFVFFLIWMDEWTNGSRFQCVTHTSLNRTPTAGLPGVGCGSERVVGRQQRRTCAVVLGPSWGPLAVDVPHPRPGLVLISELHQKYSTSLLAPRIQVVTALPAAKARRQPNYVYQSIVNSFPHFLLITLPTSQSFGWG